MRVVGIDVGIHNLSLCFVRFPDANPDDAGAAAAPAAAAAAAEKKPIIENWMLVDCAPGKNATKLSIEDSCSAVVDTLDKMCSESADIFAIEAQPCGRVATGNTKMKVVSHCIQTLFRLRFPDAEVKFINPKNKMAREYVGEVLGLEGGDAAVKQRYKKHKDAAVAAATAYLAATDDDKWTTFFQGLKKKDDAADSLLLALVAQQTTKKKKRKSRKRKRNTEGKKE